LFFTAVRYLPLFSLQSPFCDLSVFPPRLCSVRLSVCSGGWCNRRRGWCTCVSWPMLLSASVTFSSPVFPWFFSSFFSSLSVPFPQFFFLFPLKPFSQFFLFSHWWLFLLWFFCVPRFCSSFSPVFLSSLFRWFGVCSWRRITRLTKACSFPALHLRFENKGKAGLLSFCSLPISLFLGPFSVFVHALHWPLGSALSSPPCRFSFSGFYNQRMPCNRMDFNAIKASVFFFFRVKKMNSVMLMAICVLILDILNFCSPVLG